MNNEQRNIIYRFAAGDKQLRNKAVEIHRAYLAKEGLGTVEQQFMSEVDTICPDLALRAQYRAAVIDAHTRCEDELDRLKDIITAASRKLREYAKGFTCKDDCPEIVREVVDELDRLV